MTKATSASSFLKAAALPALLFSVGCAPLAIGAAGTAVGVGVAQERSLGDGFDDVGIRTRIRSGLTSAPQNFGNVDVNSVEARVLLTGSVATEDERRAAAKIAWEADGVAEVIDEIVVGKRTGPRQGGADTRIETSLRTRLIADSKIPNTNYIIVVSQGVVHLMGLAYDQPELDRVTEHARTVSGVKKVISHVQFKSDPSRRLR